MADTPEAVALRLVEFIAERQRRSDPSRAAEVRGRGEDTNIDHLRRVVARAFA